MNKKLIKFILPTVLFTVVLAGCFSCSNQDPLDDLKTQDSEKLLRTREDAKEEAVKAMGALKSESRHSSRKNMSGLNVITLNQSRSDNKGILYIVEFPEDEGFVVVSANPECEPVLAIIEQGNYSEALLSGENVGFNYFMEGAALYAAGGGGHFPINPPGPLDPIMMEK